MPQLDKVTFLSQFFWLCFFFIGFYIVLLKFFLPKMSLILKLRKTKLLGSHQNVNTLTQENDKIKLNLDKLSTNSLISSKNKFNTRFNLKQAWLHTSVENTKDNHFTSLNKNYIESVGESVLFQQIMNNFFKQNTYKSPYFYMYNVTKLLTGTTNFNKKNKDRKIKIETEVKTPAKVKKPEPVKIQKKKVLKQPVEETLKKKKTKTKK